ncbi:toll/interleukin-1 receptor domain-containing protein [Streptomyces sp. NEAU-YJ-81]|uniref:toll/interleukin-1 receptor domain-containing protein n=1 Tax=Streptomyces sp. NEAU-YJ-81 TaxID=2820288 RepID=UPI001ABCDA65|nr:toll/interleukin-1 receptor domain-containing protein [Streptomyces sp. NEAU-YJ-81]MBO3680039.1 toll/interleukin-1 receptor domain-containing protein [Streptomyces sp. NEAU-YJ-81]
MEEVFLNYRTKDGKEAAFIFDEKLSARFGTESVFRATKSIGPGANYIDTMLSGVQRSSVLLALIGELWLDAPERDRPERRALNNPKDWVRREIEEAFAHGVLVVPVLLGRKMEQLDPRRLPTPLRKLAECQYERFSLRSPGTDIDRLADRLVTQVPRLADLDKRAPTRKAAPEPGGGNHDQRGGIGTVHGTVGTFVQESNGPLHTGSGIQLNGSQFHGDGYNFGNHGDTHQEFDSPRRRREDDE